MSAARPIPDPIALLVEAAQEGHRDAFEALYRTHVGQVYALCGRLAGDAVLAEELVQQTFVRAWQRLGSYRGGSFAGWLRRIAVRTALDDRRSHRRRLRRITLADHAEPDGPDATSPPPGARLDLERAIATLPAKARHVFVLSAIEGWSHDEIATALNITAGTSRAQLFRARQLLQEALS